MINNVIDNFLPSDYFEELKSIIEFEKEHRIVDVQVGDHNDPRDDYYKYAYVTPTMGRLTLRDLKLPNHIYDFFINYIENDLGIERNNLDNRGAMFCEYSLEYGRPWLAPHYDSGDPTILLDFQIYSNTDWPIIVEDQEYILKDNSVIDIYPTNQQHWRPKQDFSKNEVVGVMFMIFHIKNLKQETLDYDLLEKRKAEWHDE